jgi:Fe-S-cluster containining protein
MVKKRSQRLVTSQVKRLSFPDDEQNHPWLPMLLDAFFVVDKGIIEALKIEAKKGKHLACKKGCSQCCKTHETIPVYPLELVGISWFIIEKSVNPLREAMKYNLSKHNDNSPCPFLIDGACSVHQVRPISCRQFNVFGKPCEEGEDPYYSRREDVLTPIKKYVDSAFFIMLPFYGVQKESDRRKIIENGSVHQVVKLLQTCKWETLAQKMEQFDKKTERSW